MSRTRRDRDIAHASKPCAERAPVAFSSHAARRADRRNVRRDGVAYVIMHGRLYYRTGALIFFLGARDLPFEDRRDPWASRLVGTVVVMALSGHIITTYRNRRAAHHIARKLKYRVFDERQLEDALGAGELFGLGAIA